MDLESFEDHHHYVDIDFKLLTISILHRKSVSDKNLKD